MILTAAQAGLVGDGETDNTAAFQRFLDTLPGGFIELQLGDGRFLTRQLTVKSNRRIVGNGPGSTQIVQSSAADKYLLSCVAASALPAANIHNLSLIDVGFEGPAAGFVEQNHLLNLNGMTDLLIDGCALSKWSGDGIYLGSSNTALTERHNRGVTITGCTFTGTNTERNGITVIDGDRVRITGCTFTNVSRSDMPGAVDIEPNTGNTFAVTRDIVVTGCTFTGTAGFADICVQPLVPQASLTTPAKRFTLIGNTHNSPDARLLYFRSLANATAATTTHDLVFTGNEQLAAITGADITLNGLAGGTFSDNTFASGFAYEIGNTEDCYGLVGTT